MKKVYFRQNEILKIAKTIKDHLPNLKIFLRCYDNKIILNLPKNTDRLKIEELKTLLKIKYPHHLFIFYSE